MKKLDITDLSIGDWVRWEGSSENYRVCSIDGVSLTVELAEKLGGTIEVGIDEVVGIPIAPEILEKNGFAAMDKNTWRNAEMRCTVFRYSKKWDIRSRAKKNKYTSVRVDVDNAEFIHQLQHALRLAGIEKEIEL